MQKILQLLQMNLFEKRDLLTNVSLVQYIHTGSPMLLDEYESDHAKITEKNSRVMILEYSTQSRKLKRGAGHVSLKLNLKSV